MIKNIDEYISSQSPETQELLTQLRELVKNLAPESTEGISYGMPAFRLNGRPLVYFSSFRKHIGFYPLPSGIEAFKEELVNYKQGKGSVQFPLNKELPIDLIQKMIKLRVKEILQK